MRILRLELLAFGPFTREKLELGGRPGALEVVYGPNEAGKSTTLRAISDVLFGIPERTRDAHRHAPSELRIGALLESRSGARLDIVRRKGRKGTLLAPDGNPLDDALLTPLLQGATRELFEGLFGLDHVRLRASAEALIAGKGSVGESLFAAGAGGRKIHRLALELGREADELFVPRARERKVTKAIAEVREARDDLRNASTSPTKYLEQERALHDAVRGRDALRGRRTEVHAEQARLTRAVTVLPGLRRRQELLERLTALGPVVELAVDAAERRAEALRDIAEADREIGRDEERAARIRERLSRLAVSEALLGVDDALLADLRDRRGSHLSAQIDRPKLVASAVSIETALEKSLETIGARRSVSSLQVTVAGTAKVRALAVRRQRIEDKLREATSRLDDARVRRDHLMGRLLAVVPSPERQAVAERLGCPAPLDLPSPEIVDRFAAEEADLSVERTRLERAREQALERRRDVERRLATLRGEGAVPTEAELTEARGRRKALWQTLREHRSLEPRQDRASIAAYEAAVDDADTLADRLRREADRVALLAGLVADEEAAREAAADVEARLREHAGRTAANRARFSAVFRSVGFEPRAPSEMREWAKDFAAVTALAPELKRLEIEVRRVDEDFTAWKSSWLEAAALLGLPGMPTEEEAFAVLDATAQLVRQVEKAEGLRKRIDGIDRDAAHFAEAVQKACRAVLPDAAGASPADAAERLVRAVEKARLDHAERLRAEAELQSLMEGVEGRRGARRDAEARLDALVTAARAAGPGELEEAERRSRDALALREQLGVVEAELLAAGDGAPLDALEAETRGLDLDRARARLRDLEGELEELAERMDRASEDAGHLDHGVHNLANTNAAAAAVLLEDRVATLKRHVRRYVRVRLASVLLAREIERYREENQGPIVARANELLPRLTLGRYSGLRIGFGEDDESVLLAVRADGTNVGVDALSDGTRDQLYLALRLASLERYARLNEPMPLVLDDVLIHSDDARSEAALGVLGEVARTTQVLFFTHHARLVELARRALGEGGLVEYRLPSA